jgi:glycerol transport system ATP-binding protein
MQLAFDHVSKKVGAEHWLYELSLASRSGAVTVLLGATQAGKTSLMRIMAGLDEPGNARVRVDGQGVTGMPVRQSQVPLL